MTELERIAKAAAMVANWDAALNRNQLTANAGASHLKRVEIELTRRELVIIATAVVLAWGVTAVAVRAALRRFG